MKKQTTTFIIILSTISIVLLFIGIVILKKSLPDFAIINLVGSVILFYSVTLIFHILLVNSSNKKVNKFIQRFLSF
ncbi:hypothetical protein ACFLTE_10705, partial [Bacteroidota bacterium]